MVTGCCKNSECVTSYDIQKSINRCFQANNDFNLNASLILGPMHHARQSAKNTLQIINSQFC